MPVATLSGVPDSIVAGNTCLFTVGDSDFPASGWEMLFVLSRNGIKLLSKAGVAASNQKDFDVTLTAAETAKVAPGRCNWCCVYTESETSQRGTGAAGSLLLLPDPTGALAQSENQKALAACQSAINKLVASPRSSVSFNGQSYTNTSIKELFDARDRLQTLVNNELAELGIGNKGGARLVRYRFT